MGLAVFFSSCSPRKEFPSSSDASGPVQIVTNSVLYLYDGPRISWRLESKELRKELREGGSTVGYPVRLTLFDSSGAERSVCLADSGSTSDRKDAFDVWGNVYVKNEEGTVVRAQRLRWDGNRHTVTSDDFVQITTANGDVMRGKGLDATESFSRWSLRKEVSGEFPNFKARMDGEDGFGGEDVEDSGQSLDKAREPRSALRQDSGTTVSSQVSDSRDRETDSGGAVVPQAEPTTPKPPVDDRAAPDDGGSAPPTGGGR